MELNMLFATFVIFSALSSVAAGNAETTVFGNYAGTAKVTSMDHENHEATSAPVTLAIDRQQLEEKEYVSILIDWRGFAWASRFLLDGEALLSAEGNVVGSLTAGKLTVHEIRNSENRKVVIFYSFEKRADSDVADFRYQVARSTADTLFTFSLIADVR
jgi:hypothetical protein